MTKLKTRLATIIQRSFRSSLTLSISLALSSCVHDHKTPTLDIDSAKATAEVKARATNHALLEYKPNEDTLGRYKNKNQALADLEEYVSRIGKRILIVMEGHHQHYSFIVNNSFKPTLTTNPAGKIELSRGLLRKLIDEAELAAVLSQVMVSLYYDNLHLNDTDITISKLQTKKIDKLSMTYMAHAGYDPIATIELQEIYLDKNHHRHGEWINTIYLNNPPTSARMKANKKVITKLPTGLHRGTEKYGENVY